MINLVIDCFHDSARSTIEHVYNSDEIFQLVEIDLAKRINQLGRPRLSLFVFIGVFDVSGLNSFFHLMELVQIISAFLLQQVRRD